MPRIIGQRIMLREFRLSDKDSLMEWVNDPDVVGTFVRRDVHNHRIDHLIRGIAPVRLLTFLASPQTANPR